MLPLWPNYTDVLCGDLSVPQSWMDLPQIYMSCSITAALISPWGAGAGVVLYLCISLRVTAYKLKYWFHQWESFMLGLHISLNGCHRNDSPFVEGLWIRKVYNIVSAAKPGGDGLMIDDWWLMIDDWWLMIDDWWLMVDGLIDFRSETISTLARRHLIHHCHSFALKTL